jgi:hypothetical protein
MESRTGIGLTMVTEAVPARVGSATLIAFTVTAFGEGGTAGAVYMPVASIVPTEESPPGIPFTAHVTEVLEVPLTVAVNCSLSRTMAVVLLGETETEMMRTAGGGALPPPPHPTDRTSCSTAAAQRNALWVPPFMTALIVRCSKVAQLVKCLNLTPKGVLPQVMGASIRLAPRFLCSPSPPTEITERCSDRQGLLELHCPLNCALEAEVRSGPTVTGARLHSPMRRAGTTVLTATQIPWQVARWHSPAARQGENSRGPSATVVFSAHRPSKSANGKRPRKVAPTLGFSLTAAILQRLESKGRGHSEQG